jgi:hypothetical protein
MTFLQKFMLSRGHPRQIILHMVGGIWTVYFLWQHEWMWALGCFAVSELISETLSTQTGAETLAQTTLGKLMLLHANPMNFLIQSLGGVLLVYCLWMHSLTGIMIATSLILLGHFVGWSKVNSALQ